MKLTALVAISAVAACLVLVTPAATAPLDQTYNDPVGDAQGGAPDLSLVTVSNVKNTISFRIVASQATLNADSTVYLNLDTDRNPATGAPDTLGTDYYFALFVDNGQPVYDFARWTGTGWDHNTPYSTVHTSYSGGASITVDRSELGNTSSFNFWARSWQDVSETEHNIDDAPNDGTWTYRLTAPGATVTAVGQTPVPYPPKAGRAFTMRVPYVRLSNGKRAKPSSYTCNARVGAAKLRGAGRGGCTFRIPANARGKTLAVVITARYGTSAKTTSFFAKIA
jgi:hypothetical protein